jgi:hypothetical protein
MEEVLVKAAAISQVRPLSKNIFFRISLLLIFLGCKYTLHMGKDRKL